MRSAVETIAITVSILIAVIIILYPYMFSLFIKVVSVSAIYGMP
jgi:hypothetical protein